MTYSCMDICSCIIPLIHVQTCVSNHLYYIISYFCLHPMLSPLSLHTITFLSTSHHHLPLHLISSPSPPHTVTFPCTSHHHLSLHLTPSPFPPPHTITFPSTSHHHLSLHLTPSPFLPPHHSHLSLHLTTVVLSLLIRHCPRPMFSSPPDTGYLNQDI